MVSDEDRIQYWRHYQRFMEAGSDFSEFLPLGLYGDDAQYNRAKDKIILVTFNSILTPPQRH